MRAGILLRMTKDEMTLVCVYLWKTRSREYQKKLLDIYIYIYIPHKLAHAYPYDTTRPLPTRYNMVSNPRIEIGFRRSCPTFEL